MLDQDPLARQRPHSADRGEKSMEQLKNLVVSAHHLDAGHVGGMVFQSSRGARRDRA